MTDMTFFQPSAATSREAERLVLQFKVGAKDLLAEQLTFRISCENKYITIDLLTLVSPYFCKLILQQFKQLVTQVFQEKIIKINMTDNHLYIIAPTYEEALKLKAILSKSGFGETFHEPGAHHAEIQTSCLQTWPS